MSLKVGDPPSPDAVSAPRSAGYAPAYSLQPQSAGYPSQSPTYPSQGAEYAAQPPVSRYANVPRSSQEDLSGRFVTGSSHQLAPGQSVELRPDASGAADTFVWMLPELAGLAAFSGFCHPESVFTECLISMQLLCQIIKTKHHLTSSDATFSNEPHLVACFWHKYYLWNQAVQSIFHSEFLELKCAFMKNCGKTVKLSCFQEIQDAYMYVCCLSSSRSANDMKNCFVHVTCCGYHEKPTKPEVILSMLSEHLANYGIQMKMFWHDG